MGQAQPRDREGTWALSALGLSRTCPNLRVQLSFFSCLFKQATGELLSNCFPSIPQSLSFPICTIPSCAFPPELLQFKLRQCQSSVLGETVQQPSVGQEFVLWVFLGPAALPGLGDVQTHPECPEQPRHVQRSLRVNIPLLISPSPCRCQQ